MERLKKKLKREGQEPFNIDQVMGGENMNEFEEFTDRSAKMKFTEHEIIHEKLRNEEIQRRLDERKRNVVTIDKT